MFKIVYPPLLKFVGFGEVTGYKALPNTVLKEGNQCIAAIVATGLVHEACTAITTGTGTSGDDARCDGT